MTDLIGLRGVAGAGKSTVAGALVAMINEDPSLRPAMADSMIMSVKDGLRAMGIRKEDSPDVYRRVAQDIGAELRRLDPDIFVKQISERRQEWSRRGVRVMVVDDLRFQNEAEVCTLVVYLTPQFAPGSLGDRAMFSTEVFNATKDGRIDLEILNRTGRPEVAAREILEAWRSM